MSRADLNAIQTKLKTAIQSHQILVARIKSDPQDVVLKKQLHDLQKEITGLSEKQKVIVQTLRRELVSRQENTDPAPKMQQSLTPLVTTQCSSPLQLTDLSLKIQNNGVPTVADVVSKLPSLKSEHRTASPPIKVPKYPGNKILQSRPHIASSSVSFKRTLSDSDLKDIKKSVGEKTNVEEKMKLTFMACLDLVTQTALKDLQNRRTERKRRSTANSQLTYSFEPERKRVTNYLANTLSPCVKRPRGRPPKSGPSPNSSKPLTPNGCVTYKNGLENNFPNDVLEEICAVCSESGDLLLCDTCNKMCHLYCLDPPLIEVPPAPWNCPNCEIAKKSSNTWSETTLAVVQSYIASKAAKEEEQRKLHKKNIDLLNDMSQLENKSNQLSECITQKCQRKQELLKTSRKTQESIEQVKNFIKVVQAS